MIQKIEISSKAQKQLQKIPLQIYRKLFVWVEMVKEIGLEKTRKIPGFHDEPLKGVRKGQRSIRLNKSYRAIYELKQSGSFELIEIQELNKHDY